MLEKFQDLVGHTLTRVLRFGVPPAHDWAIVFFLDNGEKYILRHDQDCCEEVRIEDICGDLADLVGTPITKAEECVHENDPAYPRLERDEEGDSHTWTFYQLATKKGYVTIRFYGSSNGYYSERVDFELVADERTLTEGVGRLEPCR